MIQITETSDLLNAKPMSLIIRDYGEQPVKDLLMKALIKCAVSLGIETDHNQLQTISEDILEVYRYDSIEDVIECLKKGRRGLYGFGHNSRSSVNMILINEWMSKHLDEKAEAREKELAKFKEKGIEPIADIDYEAYRKRQIENSKKKKPDNSEENAYHRFKLDYLTKKKNGE